MFTGLAFRPAQKQAQKKLDLGQILAIFGDLSPLSSYLSRGSKYLPSDTKLLLPKNCSEIIIFGKITKFTRNSLNLSFFLGNLKSSKPLKNYEK